MPYKITCYNAFYEGWLARLLGLQRIAGSKDPEAWLLGWDTAEETGPTLRYRALQEEIDRKLGHLIVEEVN